MARTGFGKYIHDNIRLFKVGHIMLNDYNVVCQFNPDRYHFWLNCAHSLRVPDSPHWGISKLGIDVSYRRYQLFLGRNEKWIDSKIAEFKKIIEDCQSGVGILERPIVLAKPIKDNPFWEDGKYEIWEGHHRIAASLAWCETTIADVYDYEIIT